MLISLSLLLALLVDKSIQSHFLVSVFDTFVDQTDENPFFIFMVLCIFTYQIDSYHPFIFILFAAFDDQTVTRLFYLHCS